MMHQWDFDFGNSDQMEISTPKDEADNGQSTGAWQNWQIIKAAMTD